MSREEDARKDVAHHKVSPEKFEREMTLVLLQLRGEFSQERVGEIMAGNHADPPAPPKLPIEVKKDLNLGELDKVIIKSTDLSAPDPLPIVKGNEFLGVAIAQPVQYLPVPPLALPAKSAMSVPEVELAQELPSLKLTYITNIPLPRAISWRKMKIENKEEDGQGERTSHLDEKKHEIRVMIHTAKLPGKMTPLTLDKLEGMMVAGIVRSLFIAPLALPAKSVATVFRAKIPEKAELQFRKFEACVPIPATTKRQKTNPLHLTPVCDVYMKAPKLPTKMTFLKLKKPTGVMVSGAVRPLFMPPLALPAKSVVTVPEKIFFEEFTSLGLPDKIFASVPKVIICKKEKTTKDDVREAKLLQFENKKPEDKVRIPTANLPGEMTLLELKKLSGFIVSGVVRPLFMPPLSLPAKSMATIPNAKIPGDIELQFQKLETCIPIFAIKKRKKGEPLQLAPVCNVHITTAELLDEIMPLKLEKPKEVTISGVVRPLFMPPLVLPSKSSVFKRLPNLPNDVETFSVKPLKNMAKTVSIAYAKLQDWQIESVPKVDNMQVVSLLRICTELSNLLMVKTSARACNRLELKAPKLVLESMALPQVNLKNHVVVEAAPDLIQLWNDIDGPIALIADFGNALWPNESFS